ncbi:MAG: carboxypeptidase regulatory-like domain-containing protein [Alphaproteobacteria bacterium]|nr:carboxypeptidase regulatory-like domain-containing protein [Alphaproteobacteria bacterium]
MTIRRIFLAAFVSIAVLELIAVPRFAAAQQAAGNDIAGTVTGPNGPEAGVWVIAETTDLPTRYIKSVVTDDRGRYLIPELPQANYEVWARGYGLSDTAKVRSAPGRTVNFTAQRAPSPQAAADLYPAIYWYSMLKTPGKDEFPVGNVRSQAAWLNVTKTNGCYGCHALGNKATRTIPPLFSDLKPEDAWARRLLSGQAMNNMATSIGRIDTQRALRLYADWTDRIAAGELPFAHPRRPQGRERNVVITQWDFSDPKHYLHDITVTDKRNPTLNANGLIYGAVENSTDLVPVLDPVNHRASSFRMPVRDPKTQSSKTDPLSTSPYWGDEAIWDSQTSTHNPMFDEKGQVWFTSRVGPPQNPDFCRKGSSHPSARVFPLESSTRHVSVLDPKTGRITLIRTCFQTHHLVFAEDADNTLWLSQGGPGSGVVGWINRRVFEETGDEARAQGWTPIVVDTNGNGKRDEWVEPNQPVDPTKDKRVVGAFYGIGVNPKDGTIWGSILTFPGYIVRVDPGPNPSETALAEIYEPPFPGYGPRGFDIDREGIAWVPLSSGHMGRFDRSKCKVLRGPETATGRHCPEGWTLYPFPGPQMMGVTDTGSAEASYYTWVDQFDTFGLGRNVPWATGNANESLMALVGNEWLNFVVPYPLGFYAKWIDGRIDDPSAGWKGRGVWATYGTRTPFHLETGKGTRPKVVKFQLRPDPLAR